MSIFTKYDPNNIDSQKFSTRRVEAITDGVFAIAMTLLVLDLGVSNLGQNITTDQQLWHALVTNLGTNFISFLISFLLLGSMWAIHVRQFEHIKYVDRHLMMINTFRLLAVVLIPFTTSLASAYPELFIAEVLSPLNYLLLALLSKWQWDYATSVPTFYDPKVLSKKAIQIAKDRNLAFIIISALVATTVVFVGSWAFALFIALPFLARGISVARKDY